MRIIASFYTGRTNQLRVHCREYGHTIVGDYRYSDRQDISPYRMMLHSHRLVIPMKSEVIDVSSPDPFVPESDPMWKPLRVLNTYDNFVMKNPINYREDELKQKGRSKDKYAKKYRHLEGGSDEEEIRCRNSVSR